MLLPLRQSFPAFGPLEFGELAAASWDEIVLINNAGTVTPIAPVHLTDDDAIQHNLNVNFNSAIRLITAFVRAFQSSTGRKLVANISSGAAQRGVFGWSLYCASKAGMENYVSALAAEQVAALHPFSCINISPGMMDTGMQAELRSADPSHFNDVARFIEFKEAGQLRRPEVVALAVSRIVASEVENGKRYTVDAYV